MYCICMKDISTYIYGGMMGLCFLLPYKNKAKISTAIWISLVTSFGFRICTAEKVSLAHVPSANLECEGFITCTTVSHQGAISGFLGN